MYNIDTNFILIFSLSQILREATKTSPCKVARTDSMVEETMAGEGPDQDEGIIANVDAPEDCQGLTEPSTPEPKSKTTKTPDSNKEKENHSTYKSKNLQKLSECKNLRRQLKRLRDRNLLAKKVLHSMFFNRFQGAWDTWELIE